MRLLRYSILPLVVLFLWWFVTREGRIPSILLPSPGAVASAAVELFSSGEGFRHAGVSLLRVFAGYAISSCAALSLAAVLARSPKLEVSAHVVLESLRVIPPLSLIPLLILWLGIDEAPKLAIVVLASFFPIYLSTMSALKEADRRYGELCAYLQLTSVERLKHVLLPGAAPQILTGLRLGFGYAWRALVGAELIAAGSGLGYLIEDAGALARTDVVLVGILMIALLGVGLDALYKHLIEKLVPWSNGKAQGGES